MGSACSSQTTYYDNDCSRALDGNDNTNYFSGSCYHGDLTQTNPWFRVDLGSTAMADRITIVNR